MSKQAAPRYMGGQAVMEGVMMRGATSWAIAVRTPEGEIEVVTDDAPRWAERYAHIPFVRGVTTLVESLSLGFKALTFSANRQVPEDERVPAGAMGWAVAIAVLFFSGVFLVLPALAIRGVDDVLGFNGVLAQVLEGALRLGLFIGYILAIGQLKDIRRVFQYHGAEHKAIAAYENDVELTPESAQQFTTEHVRCGTNFLLTVMVVAIVVYSAFGRPALPVLILSRVAMIPVIAAVSYEIIRFAAGHMRWAWVRVVMRPGLWLQKLTTRQPALDQLEVAIASLRAVMTAEQLAEVESRAGRRVPRPAPRPALGNA
jgi:uncharacterized protein YqhQ